MSGRTTLRLSAVVLLIAFATVTADAEPATRPMGRSNTPPGFDVSYLSGTVTDERSGQPVSDFIILPGYGTTRDYTLQHHRMQGFADGEFEFEFDRTQELRTGHHAILIRIESDGYMPQVVELPSEQQHVKLDLKLQKAPNIEGQITTPDGMAAQGAIVFRGTKASPVMLANDQPNLESERAMRTTTDAQGRFSCWPTDGIYRLVVIHDAGYADVLSDSFDPAKPIVLQPWGRIEGVVLSGQEPAREAEVVLQAEFAVHRDGRPNVTRESRAQCDINGRFILGRVAPGKATIARHMQIGEHNYQGRTCVTEIEVAPGQTVKVQLGGRGRPVIGQVVLPDGMEGRWVALGGVMLRDPEAAKNSVGDRYLGEVDETGFFEIMDVEPGQYLLHIQLYERDAIEKRWLRPAAIVKAEITVPEVDGGRSDEPLDAGEFVPEPFQLR